MGAWARRGPLTVLATLLLFSVWVLPAFDKSNWGPFFVWQMFSGYEETYRDIVLRGPEGEVLLSDPLAVYRDNPNPKSLMWGLAQEYGRDTGLPEAQRQKVALIAATAKDDGFAFVGFCATQIPLPRYMLMSSQEKRGHCAPVP